MLRAAADAPIRDAMATRRLAGERLPSGWTISPLKRLLKPGQEGIKIGPFGSELRLDSLAESGVPIYGQENVLSCDFSFARRFLGFDRLKDFSAYTVAPGDVLLTMMGTAGRCAVVPADAPVGIMDSHLLRLRVNQKLLQSGFGATVLHEAEYIRTQVVAESKGSIMAGLNSAIVKQLNVMLPPVSEQSAIADFLDRETEKIDALVAKKQRLVELLQEKRAALISHAVTKGLDLDVPMRDSGIQTLGRIPAHYNVRSFGKVASLQRGFDLPADEREPGDFPVVSSGGIVDSHSVGPVEPPGVVTGRYGSIGSVYWLDSAFWPHNTALYVRDFWGNEPRFVYWLLLSLSAGITAAESGKSAVPGLDQKDTRGLQVAIPPREEQLAIAAHLDAETARIDSLTNEIRRASSLFHEYRTALVTAAVTGQFDVRESAKEAS
jgi:type I restriction enzyme S subunit